MGMTYSLRKIEFAMKPNLHEPEIVEQKCVELGALRFVLPKVDVFLRTLEFTL